MTVHLRSYQPADLARLLETLGAWNAATGGCGLLHPGDVVHGMANGLRGRDPANFYELAEDERGNLLGMAMVYRPSLAGFDVCVAPDQRGSPAEQALVDWAEARAWAVMQAANVANETVNSDVMDCDPVRRQLLEARGYRDTGPSHIHTNRSLRGALPDMPLPHGYTFSTAAEFGNPDAIGSCHASAFGSSWPPGTYAAVLATPGFDASRELLVIAPDGRPAAFTVWWPDPVSRIGLFEPVGCAAEFQRRGLTRALLFEGMRRMQAAGMTTAAVNHELPEENAASAGLYASIGFEARYTMFCHVKTMR